MSSVNFNLEELYRKYVQFPFICTDTRKIAHNALFFCLKGENFDGNMFVYEALEQGAKYVITENKQLPESDAIIVVDDVLKTLQKLANYHRQHLKIPVIGITGTNGKTTTKELIAIVLSKRYKTAYTQGNFNNHIGVPLTLLSIKNDDEIAVIEMGANHPGEIKELCQIAQPEYGLITNIGKAHLEGFGSIENIIETKTALYRAARTIFVNAGDEVLKSECIKYEVESIFYGRNTKTSGVVSEMNPYLVIHLLGEKIQTNLTGNYNLDNILGAAAVGRYFGISDHDIGVAIAAYSPQNCRSQIIKKETNTIIADYYNANPTSMIVAIENFLQLDVPHKLAILGDMLELGEKSFCEHQAIIQFCEANLLKTFFVGTEFMNHKNEHSFFFMNVEDCKNYLINNKQENKFILLKGSRGIHLENIFT